MKLLRVTGIACASGLLSLAVWQYLPIAASAGPTSGTLDGGEPRQLSPVERYRLGFRLRPDTRLVRGAPRIHYLLTGVPPEEFQVSFESGLWRVQYQGHPVALLPEMAGFRETLESLTGYALELSRGRLQFHTTISSERVQELETEVNQLAPPRLLHVVQQIQAEWDPTRVDPRLLRLAARALVWLVIQSRDDLSFSDNLEGAAVAALALARLTSSRLTPEEALLAEWMGYRQDAVRLATGLEASHPVRRFVEGDVAGLQETGLASPDSVLVKCLALRALARSGQIDEWATSAERLLADTQMTGGVVASLFDLSDPFPDARVARYAVRMISQETARHAGDSGADWPSSEEPKPRDLLGEDSPLVSNDSSALPLNRPLDLIEERLGEIPFTSGPVLMREDMEAYWRGLFYSGLYRLSRHYIQVLASAQQTRNLVENLGAVRQGRGSEFRDWLDFQVDLLEGKNTRLDLLQAMDRFRLSSHHLRRFIFSKAAPRLGDNPTVLQAGQLLAAGMDSRPDHRRELAEIAYSHLQDLALTERMLQAWMEVNPAEFWAGPWHAYFLGDLGTLRRMTSDEEQSPEFREQAIAYSLRDNLITIDEAYALHRRLIAAQPGRWDRYEAAIVSLEHAGRIRDALEVANLWFLKNEGKAASRHIPATTSAARLWQRMGHPEASLSLVQPLLPSDKARVLNRAALALAGLGQLEEAIQLARKLVALHPQLAPAYACLARVLWETDQTQAAADLLRDAKHLTPTQWRNSIGTAFAEVFKDRPQAAREAFERMIDNGLGAEWLEQLVAAVDRSGSHQLAFELQSMLRLDWATAPNLPLRAALYLEKAKGREAALSWLRRAIEPGRRNPASRWIFAQGEYSLLWEFIEDPDDSTGAEYVWLMRAAAMRANPGLSTFRQPLASRVAAADGGVYWDAARFLLGTLNRQQLLQHATSAAYECKTAYFIALDALAKGNLKEASDWFQVARQSGLETYLEYQLARDQLKRWAEDGRRLSD